MELTEAEASTNLSISCFSYNSVFISIKLLLSNNENSLTSITFNLFAAGSSTHEEEPTVTSAIPCNTTRNHA
jgi:hypothetical protein